MRSTWLTRRAVLASIALVIWVLDCLLAGGWQATAALPANTLKYPYIVEWPAFAVLGVYLWWNRGHLHREVLGAHGLARLGEGDQLAGGDPQDEEVRACNDYLASLHDRPRARPSR